VNNVRSEIDHINTRLTEEGEKTIRFFQSLTETSWDQLVYKEEPFWKVRDILAHFVSIERAFTDLIQDILDGGSGAPKNFDIDHFNKDEVQSLSHKTSTQLIADFKEARSACLHMSSKIQAEDLAKKGNHPWYGDVEVVKLLKLLYRHNMIHLRDIQKVMKKQKVV
jgi:hypothetical protein